MGIWDAIFLLGGIGLFLYGMMLMSTGLKNAAGDQLRNVLERVTNNKKAAVLIGLVVTMLIQSSKDEHDGTLGWFKIFLSFMMASYSVLFARQSER